MEDKIWEYVNQYHMLKAGDLIVAGISGGADSVCLFFMLLKFREQIPFDFQVVHVHHGLRREADDDAAFVEALCRKYRIPCQVFRTDVRELAQQQGISEEEAGRRFRYEAYERMRSSIGGNKICTAHHMDDQAETVLFRLFRGSGLKGLGGIRPVQGNRIHPLLCVRKAEIEEYLTKRRISWVEDASNRTDHYARNRIRNHLLPYAEKELCSGASEHVAAAAEILMQTQAFVERQTKEALPRTVLPPGNRISLRALHEEDPYIQRQIILTVLESMTAARRDITAKHMQAIAEMAEKEGNRQLSLPYGLQVSREYDELVFRKITDSAPETGPGKDPPGNDAEILLTIPGSTEVPGIGVIDCSFVSSDGRPDFPRKTYTKWLDYDKIEKSLVFRVRKTGDYIMIYSDGRPCRKSIKQYMIDRKIPAEQRSSIPLLADGNHILWIPGGRLSETVKITKETVNILQISVRGAREELQQI